MKRQILAVALAVSTGSPAVLANEFGTAEEARAMLDRVVAEVETDEAAALAMFTNGEGGFKDRDLYPYCVGPDGNFSAHPTLVGTNATTLKDKAGALIGEKVIAAATPGEISEVTYVWTRPGEDTPAEKVAFVTRIGDQICAVGYYR